MKRLAKPVSGTDSTAKKQKTIKESFRRQEDLYVLDIAADGTVVLGSGSADFVDDGVIPPLDRSAAGTPTCPVVAEESKKPPPQRSLTSVPDPSLEAAKKNAWVIAQRYDPRNDYEAFVRAVDFEKCQIPVATISKADAAALDEKGYWKYSAFQRDFYWFLLGQVVEYVRVHIGDIES